MSQCQIFDPIYDEELNILCEEQEQEHELNKKLVDLCVQVEEEQERELNSMLVDLCVQVEQENQRIS